MEGRIKEITSFNLNNRNVLYLSQRDHRIIDNYSLNLSISLSNSTLYVGTVLTKIKMNNRQSIFIREGLKILQQEYHNYNIELVIIDLLYDFIEINNVGCIVTDFSPLRESVAFCGEIEMYAKSKQISFYVCDAYNIVPCFVFNSYSKTSKAVKTKLFKLWPKYFVQISNLEKQKSTKRKLIKDKTFHYPNEEIIEQNEILQKYKPGTKNGLIALDTLLNTDFSNYKKYRTKASKNNISDLAIYIHTGHLSMYTIISRAYKQYSQDNENVLSLIDDLFVCRQTAEHFCYFEKNYDNINGALEWAYNTLKEHTKDKRDKIYSLKDLEFANTDDEDWNAAQNMLVIDGKMHNYVRMYWSKKLLYWTETPEKAIEYAVYLMDKYGLEGSSVNSYYGIMWSICGTMDQGFKENNIIGKIRG